MKRMFHVSLPPGMIGLRSLFEDERTLGQKANPVKWEDPITFIGNADDKIIFCEKRQLSGLIRGLPGAAPGLRVR
jgi:hypothetical protein